MGIAVVGAVAQRLHEAGGRVPKVKGSGQGALLAHVAGGLQQRLVGRVGLGRGGQVDGRLAHRDPPLRQPHEVHGVLGRHRHLQCLRVRVADVLGREDDHSAGDEERVLPGLDHPHHPVDGGVGVAAAQALDEGGDQVVVLLAGLVVTQGAELEGLLHVCELDARGPGVVARQRHRPFQAVERHPGIPLRPLDQHVPGLRRHLQGGVPQSPAAFRQSPVHHPRERVLGQRMHDADPATGEQRRDQLEGRVLGGGADEGQQPRLHVRQEGVLLGLVEVVDLVHQEHHRDGASLQPPGVREDFPELAGAGAYRGELDAVRLAGIGQEPGQGRLAAARRTPEDDGLEPAGVGHAAQQLAGTEEVLLPQHLAQAGGPHALRQGCVLPGAAGTGGVEQFHGVTGSGGVTRAAGGECLPESRRGGLRTRPHPGPKPVSATPAACGLLPDGRACPRGS